MCIRDRDNAIRSNFKKVEKYYKYFSDLKLLDYKVRILNTGTGATTRVSIESTDKTGKSWFTIGVSQNIIVSNQAGRSNIISRLENYGIKIDSKDIKVQTILNEVKEREFTGYSYDGADASFELLANKLLGKLPEYLKVKNYNVNAVSYTHLTLPTKRIV